MKKHKCAFAGCKYKHLAMICVLHHMFKDHGLRINGRKIVVNNFSCEKIDANVLGDEK